MDRRSWLGRSDQETYPIHPEDTLRNTSTSNVSGLNFSVFLPFKILIDCSIQLVFSSFYLGITAGALQAATGYAKTKTRPWPYISGGSQDPNSAPAQHATDEFYILERMGNFAAHLRAAEALADSAGKAITELYASAERGVTNGHGNGHINGHSGHDSVSREAVTAQARGQVAELVASVKIVATDTGLRVTGGMMEVTGARATARKAGMDRFWRDVRTHALHDPVAYKNREVGRYVLLGEVSIRLEACLLLFVTFLMPLNRYLNRPGIRDGRNTPLHR